MMITLPIIIVIIEQCTKQCTEQFTVIPGQNRFAFQCASVGAEKAGFSDRRYAKQPDMPQKQKRRCEKTVKLAPTPLTYAAVQQRHINASFNAKFIMMY